MSEADRQAIKRLGPSVVVVTALSVAVAWLVPFSAGPSPSAIQTMVAMLVCAVLLAVAGPADSRAMRMLYALVAWAMALLVTAHFSEVRSPLLGLAAALVVFGATLYTGAALRHGGQWMPAVAAGWLAAAVVSAVIGWLQFLDWSAPLDGWISPTPQGQVFGNLRQRNQFATLMNIGLGAVLWLEATRTRRGRWGLAGVGVLVVLLTSANALSASRTGLLGLGLVSMVYVLWRAGGSGQAWRWTLLGLAGYCATTLGAYEWTPSSPTGHAGLLARAAIDAGACHSRWTLWSNVIELIVQHPLGGWGWGELDRAHYLAAYSGPRFCEILDNAHNLPLHLVVELGAPLTLLAVGVGGWLIFRCRPWREKEPVRQLAWLVLALLALHSLVEYPLWYGPFQMSAGLVIGLLSGALPTRQRVASPAGRARWSLAALLVVSAAYAAWDYWRISQLFLPVQARAAAYRDHTLAKVSDSWLFRDQVRFAELVTTPITPANAARLHALAQQMLHYSPEPQVIERLIDSAALLGRADEVAFHAARYAAAFPAEHARWRATRRDSR